jgi:hypothetical protein
MEIFKVSQINLQKTNEVPPEQISCIFKDCRNHIDTLPAATNNSGKWLTAGDSMEELCSRMHWSYEGARVRATLTTAHSG